MSLSILDAKQAFDTGRVEEAIGMLNALARKSPTFPVMLFLGKAYHHQGRMADAAAAFEKAAGCDGSDAITCLRLATKLYADCDLNHQANTAALKLLQVAPGDSAAAASIARVAIKDPSISPDRSITDMLLENGAAEYLQLALKIIARDPMDERLLPLLKRLCEMFPDNAPLIFSMLGYARQNCDYETLQRYASVLDPAAALANPHVYAHENPVDNLSWCENEAANRLSANMLTDASIDPLITAERRTRPHAWGSRLRIGYLSRDLRSYHAVMRQLLRVLVNHDRTRFDVTLFCYASAGDLAKETADRSEWGNVVILRDMDDDEAAREIRRHDIDILVDLAGHSLHNRSTILNRGPAPIQVGWLGFPASATGLDCDYVIGDGIVLPDSARPFYHEKICRLPVSYMPNDPLGRTTEKPLSRAIYGLPDDKFVFASFNSQFKITPALTVLWARILGAVPSSVLWMSCRLPLARQNFITRMASLGITPDRIIFANDTSDHSDHVRRLAAADLALDTFPYNGHVTSSDMLWTGLPVVARVGKTFVGRVTASQLNAMGLPELVAEDDDGYCRLAIELAGDPERLKAYRDRLIANRLVAPLFDAERFCRHLESAFEIMAARARAGELPEHFEVAPLPAREHPFSI